MFSKEAHAASVGYDSCTELTLRKKLLIVCDDRIRDAPSNGRPAYDLKMPPEGDIEKLAMDSF